MRAKYVSEWGTYALSSSMMFVFSGCVALFNPITNTVSSTTPSATQLKISAISALTAGACNSLTVQAQDSSGNAAAVASDTAVTLGGASNGAFYSDSACQSAATTTTIAAGSSSSNVYYFNLTTESPTLTATATGLTSASNTIAAPTTSKAQLMVGGSNHVCAVRGQVMHCWGYNAYGQCGRPNGAPYYNIGDGAGEMASGSTVSFSGGRYAISISDSSGVPSGSGDFSCAVLNDGSLSCFGTNGSGEYGPGDSSNHDTPTDVALPSGTAKQVSTGTVHTCVVFTNGDLRCVGLGATGRLGYGNTTSSNNLATQGVVASNVKKVVAGGLQTCALYDNGDIKCWGDGGAGQLGLGGSTSPMAPTAAINFGTLNGNSLVASDFAYGAGSGCAILNEGRVKCWGLNWSGQGMLGIGDLGHIGDAGADMGDSLPYTDLGTNVKAASIHAGGNFFCAILTTGAVKCWGNNSSRQLGLGDTTVRGDGANPAAVAAKMGDNLPTLNLGGKKAVALGLAHDFGCALLEDDSVRCWGDGDYGRLGQGDTTDWGTPAPAITF
jgi:alpha-tubulin suppressor-like RCC1 family protein